MVDESIINKIAKEITNLEYYEPTRLTIPEKNYTDKFFTNIQYNRIKLDSYIKDVIESQGRYIIECIKNKKTANIPKLGSFKCNYIKKIKLDKKSQLQNSDMSDEEKRLELRKYLSSFKMNNTDDKIHNIVLNNIKKHTHIK